MTPSLRRVVIEGAELTEMDVADPGAGMRLLLPPAPDRPIDRPVWNGNAYFAEDGSRPPIRTMTPLDQDPAAGRLAFEVVRHDGGLLTPWVDAVALGGQVAVSGPSRGYLLDPGVSAVIYAGDESALPAIAQLVRSAPDDVAVHVVIELRDREARVTLADRPALTVEWLTAEDRPGDALVAAVAALDLGDERPLWAAGEAAAMQRIRTEVVRPRDMSRAAAHVRGYWKHGRAED